MIRISEKDNMDLMARYPDNHFDLAIVDPPYGLGKKLTTGGGSHLKFKNHKEIENWDVVPSQKYFDELFRISKNQLIWGGNYFNLPPTRGFAIWNKMQSVPNFSACEFCWSSIDTVSKLYSYRQAGFIGEKKIHPVQKPVKLYEWLLDNYAKEGDKILDTHLGSGSIAIACHNRGFDLIACELDTEYYQAAMKRLEQHQRVLQIDYSK